MTLRYLGILGAVTALLSTVAFAGPSPTLASEGVQLPPLPFGRPGPGFPGAASCSPQYQRLLQLQVDAMRQLRRLSRSEGEKLCSTLETADVQGVDKLIDPKAIEPLLTPDQRDLLGALGIDLSRVDLRQITQQCRQSQGDLDRFASGELGRLASEMIRCDDRI